MEKVCIIGLGYIGLPTAVILASKNIKFVRVDINNEIVKKINQGITHINEPKLKEKLLKVIKNSNLKARTKPVSSDVFVIAVPTPYILGEKWDSFPRY